MGKKIDTEGFELEVLKGAKETLKKCKFEKLYARLQLKKRSQNSLQFLRFSFIYETARI